MIPLSFIFINEVYPSTFKKKKKKSIRQLSLIFFYMIKSQKYFLNTNLDT